MKRNETDRIKFDLEMKWNGTERNGTERNGTNRNQNYFTLERNIMEWNGTERIEIGFFEFETERNGTERNGTNQNRNYFNSTLMILTKINIL